MFKNAIAFRLNETVSLELFQSIVEENRIVEIQPFESSVIGFDEVEENSLFAESDDTLFFKVKQVNKILPKSVIEKLTNKNIKAAEVFLNRPLTRIERTVKKEEAVSKLMPMAFTKDIVTSIFIDNKNMFVVVDCGSLNAAVDTIAFIRKALGSLAITPINLKKDVSSTITGWVYSPDSIPDELSILGDFWLSSCDVEKKKSSFKVFETEELSDHIDNGSVVDALSVSWNDELTFKMDSNLVIKGVKDTREVEVNGDDQPCYETDSIINRGLLVRLFNDLIKSLGGELIPV